MVRLWRQKKIEDLQREAAADSGLKRTLGPLDLIAIGIGGIIGAGIFVLTGQAAAKYAGPAIVLSFVLAAVACAFAGLCYAEFASMIPLAGSAYTYSYATLGELFAWFIGWNLLLEYSMGAAAVAVGWSGYLVSLLNQIGIHLPPEFIASPGTRLVFLSGDVLRTVGISVPEGWYELNSYIGALQQAGIPIESLYQAKAFFDLPAFALIILLSGLLIKGIRESAVFNFVVVIVKIAVILLVIGVGIAFVKTSNWTPFFPENSGKFGEFGWSGVARGAAVVFFAYLGFDAVSTAAQESRNPQRDMPIGILVSLGICTVLYILVALIITGIVPFTRLNVADPMAIAIDATGVEWLAALVKMGAIAGLTSVVLVLLLGQPRILFTMAHDGLLPLFFARISPRFGTPINTTIGGGLFVAAMASLVPVGTLGELVSIGTLTAFAFVCVAVLVLRYRRPNLSRPFRTPWVPYAPVLGIVCCLYLALSLPYEAWMRLLVWTTVGLIIYFSYGMRHSRLGNLPTLSNLNGQKGQGRRSD